MTEKYRRKIALALIGLTVASCSALGGLGEKREPAPRLVQVLSQSYTVTGPDGFCIDESATRDNSSGAFVMLASCAALSGNKWEPRPGRPAILTVSVLPSDTPLGEADLDQMTAFFSTEDGQQALLRPGSEGPAIVTNLNREPGLLIVEAQEQTPPSLMAPGYWRGVFPEAQGLVTITVGGFERMPLDEKQGQELLYNFLNTLRGANGGDITRNQQAGGVLASVFNRLRN